MVKSNHFRVIKQGSKIKYTEKSPHPYAHCNTRKSRYILIQV